MRTKAPSLLPLFRSPLQVRLLHALLHAPERAWTADELRDALSAPPASVHRELRRALDAGVVRRDEGARPYRYSAAPDSPAYEPLRRLLDLTVGVEDELRQALKAAGGVDAAAIHGSWAAGRIRPTSDIDLVVVGTVDYEELARTAQAAGRRLGRRVDLVAFSPGEFTARAAARDGFVRKLLEAPRIDLVGDVEALARA